MFHFLNNDCAEIVLYTHITLIADVFSQDFLNNESVTPEFRGWMDAVATATTGYCKGGPNKCREDVRISQNRKEIRIYLRRNSPAQATDGYLYPLSIGNGKLRLTNRLFNNIVVVSM